MEKWLIEVRSLEETCKTTKAEVKQRQREGGEPYSIPVALCDEKERLTLLYSIRAHARGRLHMTKRRCKVMRRVPEGNWEEVWETKPWTMEDQAKLVADHGKEFKKAA